MQINFQMSKNLRLNDFLLLYIISDIINLSRSFDRRRRCARLAYSCTYRGGCVPSLACILQSIPLISETFFLSYKSFIHSILRLCYRKNTNFKKTIKSTENASSYPNTVRLGPFRTLYTLW